MTFEDFFLFVAIGGGIGVGDPQTEELTMAGHEQIDDLIHQVEDELRFEIDRFHETRKRLCKVLRKTIAEYRRSHQGHPLHNVLDDGNVGDAHIAWALGYLAGQDKVDRQAADIAQALLLLPEDDRFAVVAGESGDSE